MTNQDNYCVIMGGGIGSRFWPFSRKTLPKQFLDSSERAVHFYNRLSTGSKRLSQQKIFSSLPMQCMRT